ncbi:P-loop NTPase fold protein [Streptococcus gordonii]|uniref:P-loop NTPase fold protein n=1 Tax=Streptococcus gordonii TaxID=1302 RepID=UPI0039C41A66
MDYITNAINNYIDNKDPYALQIDGEWGSGKTFFINDFSNTTQKAKVIYFSIYGYNDFQNLKTELLSQIATELNQSFIIKTGKKLNSTLKRFNINSNLVLNSINVLSDITLKKTIQHILEKNNETIVVVIDDLERLSEKIELQDLLGFIVNDIIEKFKFKVLIISNEAKMKKHQEFLKIKEKIISKTIEFSRDEVILQEILQEIIKSDFLNDNLNWIIDIFSIFDNPCKINLRTVFSIINNFEFVERKFKEHPSDLDERYCNEFLKSVFLNIYVLTTELKSGNIKNEQIHILKKHDFDRFFYINGKLDNENYWHLLIDKYHSKSKLFDDYIIYSNSIMSYVISGIWYDDNYRNKWYECFYPDGIIEDYEKLSNFYNYSESELVKIQERLLIDCFESDITYNKVIDIYRRLSYFETIDLLLIEKSKLDDLIVRITELLSDNDLSIQEISSLENSFIFDPPSNTGFKKLKEVVKEKIAFTYSARTLDLIEAIFNEDYKKEKSIIDHTNSEEIRVFQSIISNNLISTKITSKNNKAYSLATFIDRQYLRVSNSKDYHQDEIQDVKQMIVEINELFMPDKLDKVDRFKINHLLNKLEKLLEHWKK